MNQTILIVDDIDANLYLLRTILSHNGYIVKEAKHGKEALEIAFEAPPDLIVSDILMPIMDGFALCKAWRQDETLKKIPFIFYTATYTEPKDADFALSLGADRFLIKPMEGRDFVQEIVDTVKNYETSNSMSSSVNTNPTLLGAEEDFYKVYNSRLIHKLEDKLVELEIKNGELLEKEKVIRRLNENLEEKVRIRTEELSMLNEDLESFNYSVSHDLRAPLRHILGFSKILMEDHSALLNPDVRENLDRIHHAGQKMDVIIHALLRLSKLKATNLKKTHVNLSVIAENIVARLAENKENRKIDIHVQPDIYADCDKDMLQIALENLLGNAWKYTSKNDVTMITFGCQSKNGNDIIFVKDNGSGFDMKNGEELFKPFKRLHSQGEFEGIGIGLATVKRIISHHNGRVWAEGRSQEGSCFYFTLP